MTNAHIAAIEYYLPEATLTNEQLASQFPGWTAEKIESKTGIFTRHVAAPDQWVSDLAEAAARRLFDSGACSPDEIDFLLLCTQTPDYLLPTTACLLQERLGLEQSCGALDLNLGCSGYVYGLSLAKGLIETGQAKRILLINADTYTKLLHPEDKSVRTIFGDAAAATLVKGAEGDESMGSFVFGTDGSGGPNLIAGAGGMKALAAAQGTGSESGEPSAGPKKSLHMNGPEIFSFTLRVVPKTVAAVLEKAGCQLNEIDLCVFHQANRFMLEHLMKKLNVPAEKFWIGMDHCGNTVSATIPIALKQAQAAGRLRSGDRVLIMGFGVGYSWAGGIVRWQ